MFRRAGTAFLILALLLGGALPLAWAARLQYGRVRKLKACIGLVPSMGEFQTTGPADTRFDRAEPDPDAMDPGRSPDNNPYLFHVLKNRNDLRPDGWDFVNPAAPAAVTLIQHRRAVWLSRGVASPEPNWTNQDDPTILPVGSVLTPDEAAYWEVAIRPENFDRLAQMDVIYIPIGVRFAPAPAGGDLRRPIGFTYFTEQQRHLLTRLADSGVTIWVDWAEDRRTLSAVMGGLETNFRTKNPFFTNLDFVNTDTAWQAPANGHPLLEAQYEIPLRDTLTLGKGYGRPQAPIPSTQDRAVTSVLTGVGIQPTANFTTVVPTTAGATVAGAGYVLAARFGGGYVIATAGNFGGAITKSLSRVAWKVGNADIGPAEIEDLKFAYNVFAWPAEVTAVQKNSRHNGQGSVSINGLVLQSEYPGVNRGAPGTGQPWTVYNPAQNDLGTVNPTSPLIINGVVVSALRRRLPNGNLVSELSAFDANPNRDYDQLGFADEPLGPASLATNDLADFSIGLPYDKMMSIPGAPLITGLCVGEVPDTTSSQRSRAYVFATGSNNNNTASLFSTPVPRSGPNPDPFIQGSIPKDVGVQFTGAAAFANLPGLLEDVNGVSAARSVMSTLYAGGVYTQSPFGGPLSGKLLSYRVGADGRLFNGDPADAEGLPEWYYPANQEGGRMGAIAGPVTTAQVEDASTGAVDTMVLVTTVASNDSISPNNQNSAGDTAGRVDGFIVATKGDPLTFPRGNNAPGGGNPTAGRRFVCARWVDIPPGTGQVPQPAELIWDETKHWEVRVIDRKRGLTLHRFLPETPDKNAGFAILRDGTAGQVQLPEPRGAVLGAFAAPGKPNQYDLDRFVLVADYSPLPQPVDQNGKTIRPRFSPATPYERDVTNQANVLQDTGVAGGVSVGRDNLIYYGTGIGFMCAAEWRRGRAAFRWKMRALEYFDKTGKTKDATELDPTNPNYLSDYAFAAAPAAGERIVFAAKGRNGAAGHVYVLEPNATIRFKLQSEPLTAARAQEVMLRADHGIAVPQEGFIRSTQQPWGRVSNQFSVDPDTATVTFLNMENFSLNLQKAESPGWLLANQGIDTGGKPAVPIEWKFSSESGLPSRIAWIPLPVVATYSPVVDPAVSDAFFSGPVISGGRIFLMGSHGYLHELPVDPKEFAPDFPRATDASVLGLAGFDLTNYGARRLREVALDPAGMVRTSPAISNGILATVTRRGLTIYNSPSIVIADANRVVEASGDAQAISNVDLAVKQRTDISDFAIPTDAALANTGGRPLITERKLLSRIASVKKLDRNSSLTAIFSSSSQDVGGTPGAQQNTAWAQESYIAADTGNDRIVEFNPAGKVVWELNQIQDPFHLLPQGESKKLAGPMDVQRWVEREVVSGSAEPLYVIHTLIADTGNTRIIEVVDKVRYQNGVFTEASYPTIAGQVGDDGNPIRWYHVLVWSSQTNAQGLKLKYRTAQRVFWMDQYGDLLDPWGGAPPSPGVADTSPPYLAPERWVSYTMATVTGMRIGYPGVNGIPATATLPTVAGYNLLWQNGLPPEVVERKPLIRANADSIVFLRGRWEVNETGGMTPAPFKEDMPGAAAGGDRYRYSQGVIDPNVATISDVTDEIYQGRDLSVLTPVHTIRGANSVQRTMRIDVKFAPETYENRPLGGQNGIRRAMYFLVADGDGVWEARMLPGTAVPYLAWAFTNEDYAYATGAGNGNPGLVFSKSDTDNNPGGRLLTAFSARRYPSGLVLISSGTPNNDNPPFNPTSPTVSYHRNAGGDVFLLNANDYRTARERQAQGNPATYNRAAVGLHGWRPDLWLQRHPIYSGAVQNAQLNGTPSIRWRMAEQLNPALPPTLSTPLVGGTNPYELRGTYIPSQPAYADLVIK